MRNRLFQGAGRVFASIRVRRDARVRIMGRPDGGSIAVSRLAATLRPGTTGGVTVAYRVGVPLPEGTVPLLTRVDDGPWAVVDHFRTEGTAAKALMDLVLPPPSFSFNWRSVAATAAVVAIALVLLPTPSPRQESGALAAAGRQLSPLQAAVLGPVAMPDPHIQAPQLAQPGDAPLEMELGDLLSCDE